METFEQQQERKWREQQAAGMMSIPARSQHAPIQAHGLDTIGYDYMADTQLQMAGRERMKQRIMVDNFDELFKQVRAYFPSSSTSSSSHMLVPSQAPCDTCGPSEVPPRDSRAIWISEQKRSMAQAAIALLGVLAVSLVL
jgi:hypothetical protein